MILPAPERRAPVHLPMRSAGYVGITSSMGLLSPRVMKLVMPSFVSILTIRWVFLTFVPSMIVQKEITSSTLSSAGSFICWSIIRSPWSKVGFIDCDSTVRGMNPKSWGTPLLLVEEKTRIVTSSAKMTMSQAKTFAVILSTFFMIRSPLN